MSNCGHGYVNTVSSPWKPRGEGGRGGHRLQEGHKIHWVPAFLSPTQSPCLPAHKLAGGASVPRPIASLPSASSTLSCIMEAKSVQPSHTCTCAQAPCPAAHELAGASL